MSRNDNITVQSADPVPLATGNMSVAEIDDIARRASAVEVSCKMDASTQSDSANEAKVAGELGIEIAGGGMLKVLSTACEILGDRVDAGETHLSDPTSGKTDGIVSGKASTMDQMIRKSFTGEQIVMGANIAHSSLQGQDKDCVGTWSVNSAKMGGGFDLAKRCTFDKEIANRQAMDSVYTARMGHDATMHRARQIMPGMMMSPNLRPSESLSMAELRRAEEVNQGLDRWRSGGTTWSGEGDASA